MKINNSQNLLLICCRIIIGLVFVFSGFVKGIGPLGTIYKLTDYFDAFNMGFLELLSLAFFVLLNILKPLSYIDFHPYKTGSNVPKGISITKGAPKDLFTYSLLAISVQK